jgi:signal transduction histidine kinase
MRLWMKVSLITISTVLLAIGICSLVMLVSFERSTFGLAVENVLANQSVRATAWTNAMEAEAGPSLAPSAQRSLARYLIQRFASENTILASGDDLLFNRTAWDPREALPVETPSQHYIVKDIEGHSLLFVGSSVTVNNTTYTLYEVKDITSVYAGLANMTVLLALTALAAALLCAALAVVLVRLALRPVSLLKRGARLIADGHYEERVEVTGHDEIGELTEDFNKMASTIEHHVGELQDEAARRMMFIAALTHELKTPLTSLSGNAQTLLHTRLDEDGQQEVLIAINTECLRMEALSQRLARLLLLEQEDTLELTCCRVDDLLEAVRLSCAEQLRQRGLTLEASSSIDSLMLDQVLFQSLLLNLIDNAGKASAPGNVVRLSVCDNMIVVEDTGKGIPHDELDRITQAFYRVDKARTRSTGGFGLGLALADRIAKLHHARLCFESVEGEGTKVKVVFGHALPPFEKLPSAYKPLRS